jgi:hypothetical protein
MAIPRRRSHLRLRLQILAVTACTVLGLAGCGNSASDDVPG